jgi:hypothetical protein
MCIRANHDTKLIMNGGETNTLTWYIGTYATKKQQQCSNVSALLAKRVAFYSVKERGRRDVMDVNKHLIQRCANTLTRDREFSAPEIVSYLMGWGDRFESHHYVAIYTEAIIAALKEKFHGLGPQRATAGPSDAESLCRWTNGLQASSSTNIEEHAHRITMVSGVITLKDQLHEYMFRGEEISDMSLFCFLLDTYDTNDEQGDDNMRGEKRKSSGGNRPVRRPPHQRVAYQEGFNRRGRCHVFQTVGHKTLPHFVGRWLPRNDRPQERELYCASILTLLKPWSELSDLKTDTESFKHAFNSFLSAASKQTHDIIENIQFYYECYDGAKQRLEGGVEGVERTIDYEDEACQQESMTDPLGFQAGVTTITEEDIEITYETRGTMRERLHAEVTMNIAIECGVFSDIRQQTVFLAPAERAHANDLEMYCEWDQQLKAACRTEANEGGPGVFESADAAAVTLGAAGNWSENVQRQSRSIDQQLIAQRPKRELLTSCPRHC